MASRGTLVLKLAEEVVAVPETFHNAATHIHLFTVAVLSIILPLTHIVIARVYDATVAMPLVVFELALVEAVWRDLFADSLTITLSVQLAQDLRHSLALAELEVEVDRLPRLVFSLHVAVVISLLRPIFDVLLDFLKFERPQLLPLLSQVV